MFGCEGRGLPESLIESVGDQALKIPMKDGSTRSLNLSTAVAIVLYEAVRQNGILIVAAASCLMLILL